MTKSEYLLALRKALSESGASEIDDIVSEYGDHFAFKMRDGFSEEEISAKLGNPQELAKQFETTAPIAAGRKAITVTGLVFADIFAGAFSIILFAITLVLATAAVSFFVAGLYMVSGISSLWFMPSIPYASALLFSLGMFALSVLTACGALYYNSYAVGLVKSYMRFHKNCMAGASGKAPLPPLPVQSRITPKKRRLLRTYVLASLIFCVFFLATAYIVSSFAAKSLEFWHVWNWFQ